MLENLLIARLQMAYTLGFHIIFACFGIVLPLFLLICEVMHQRTGDQDYLTLAKKWTKATVILFAIGAVSGTILSFELGILWPRFMDFAGPIFALPFAIEGYAFFFEVVFLALYAYAGDHIPRLLRLVSVFGVFLCAAFSGFVVIAANGWMNAPTGFDLNAAGEAININIWDAMFNTAFISQSVHMTIAALQSVAFFIAGVYAFLLLWDRQRALFRKSFSIAIIIAFVSSALQLLTGDMLAKYVCREQPIKCAAMEAHYETVKGAPLRIGGIPDEDAEIVRYSLDIPYGLSVLAFSNPMAEVKGLKELTPDPNDRPPVTVVHFAFQIMIACGMAMLGLAGLYVLYWLWRGVISPRLKGTEPNWSLPDNKWILLAFIASAPLGFIAVEAGWTVTEVGRQPWIIYQVMRVADAVTVAPISYQFYIILVLYVLLFIAVLYTLYHLLIRNELNGNKE